MYYINCFFIYSILGYFLEMYFGDLVNGTVESGILYGPWTPVYGFAAVFILVISNYIFKNMHKSRWVETIIVFVCAMVISVGLEWLGGMIIEYGFGFSWWDYTDYKYNFGKYICLEMALVWGVLSILFVYVIRPLFDEFIKKIPLWITILFIILFVFDFIFRVLVELGVI